MNNAQGQQGQTEIVLHASCIAYRDRAVLITGKSGAGKSALALQLMALGCTLVSDDRTIVRNDAGRLIATSPSTIRGLIEARGVGLLRARTQEHVPVTLLVDLDQVERARLPVRHTVEILEQTLTCLHDPKVAHFPAAVFQILREGRADPT